jgi:predicted nucleotidyltransferase
MNQMDESHDIRIIDIIKQLEDEKVKYAVIGGIAVVLYGYVRFTKDVDLIIDFSKENVVRFVKAIDALGFRAGVPVDPLDLAVTDRRTEWMKEKNAKVITFYNPQHQLLQIDVLLTKSLDDVCVKRHQIDDVTVSVVEYEDLVKMKKETGRDTDLIDIKKLEELKKDSSA